MIQEDLLKILQCRPQWKKKKSLAIQQNFLDLVFHLQDQSYAAQLCKLFLLVLCTNLFALV